MISSKIVQFQDRERIMVSFPFISEDKRILRHYLWSLRTQRRIMGAVIKQPSNRSSNERIEYFILFPAAYFHVVIDVDGEIHSCSYDRIRVGCNGELIIEPWNGGFPIWCDVSCEQCFKRQHMRQPVAPIINPEVVNAEVCYICNNCGTKVRDNKLFYNSASKMAIVRCKYCGHEMKAKIVVSFT